MSRSTVSVSVREWFRFALSLTLIVALVEYARFAYFVTTGNGTAAWRPDVADAFLPLGGVAALRVWLQTGFWDNLHPVALVVMIAIIVTAWLFRRAACSWLCPIGMLSEFFGKLGMRVRHGKMLKVPKWLDRTLIAIKYVLTTVILLMLFVAPVASLREFMSGSFYATSDMKLYSVYTQNFVIASLAIGGLLVLSMFVKSAWCRYICPYGALQGIFGLVSPTVLSKNPDTCTSCGTCNKACPNAVDVASVKKKAVVSAECMGCGSCVEACPQADTLSFKVLGKWKIDPKVMGADVNSPMLGFLGWVTFVVMTLAALGLAFAS